MILTREFLGDQGYVYADPETGEMASAGTPISSQLDLVPNPELVDRFDGMSPYEIGLAQIAYNVFHEPFVKYAREAQNLPRGRYLFGVHHFVEEGVLPELEPAFKLFRRIMGETEYRGLEIELSDEKSQTPLDEYFDLASRRRMVINKWIASDGSAHDVKFHLMGSLLASPGVASLIEAAAVAGETLENEKDKEEVGNAIDYALSAIQNIWKGPTADEVDVPGPLSDHAATLRMYSMGVKDLPRAGYFTEMLETGQKVAQIQAELISDWRQQRPFVVPAAA